MSSELTTRANLNLTSQVNDLPSQVDSNSQNRALQSVVDFVANTHTVITMTTTSATVPRQVVSKHTRQRRKVWIHSHSTVHGPQSTVHGPRSSRRPSCRPRKTEVESTKSGARRSKVCCRGSWLVANQQRTTSSTTNDDDNDDDDDDG